MLTWAPAVAISVALGFVYTLVNSIGRPTVLTLLSHTSVENRGAVMGLNITFSSLGWLGATGLGGLVLGVAGFPGLAVMTCLFGLLGGALALVAWLGSRQAATESPRA
jgi:predicted MFS family arabinose efflux permease